MVTEPYLRFATGGEEQEISEHNAVEKAIELSTNVRKADSIQAAPARSSVGQKTSKGRTGSLRCATQHFALTLNLVSSLRQDSYCQKYSRRKRWGFALRRH